MCSYDEILMADAMAKLRAPPGPSLPLWVSERNHESYKQAD